MRLSEGSQFDPWGKADIICSIAHLQDYANNTPMRLKCNFFSLPRRLPWLAVLACVGWAFPGWSADWPTVAVQPATSAASASYDGKVEAVREARMAAQVPGTVLELNVRAGDRVRAGQTLLRIDARAAEQGASASGAQVVVARAQLDVAAKELARKRQLHDKNYISQAALDQAEAAYRAAQAQVDALAAQAQAAQTQARLHAVQAPFDGVVAQVLVERGDMAMPGKPLLTVYDPAQLRVSAFVPVTALGGSLDGAVVWLQGQALTPVRVQVLPTVDAASMTREVRAELAAGVHAAPGLFARLVLAGAPLPVAAQGGQRLFVPAAAVVRRAEMTGVYVPDASGAPLLRQVRLGAAVGDQVEVVSGLAAGAQVITNPQAATRAAAARQDK
jgi:RND family efflux transporter MFP subunit